MSVPAPVAAPVPAPVRKRTLTLRLHRHGPAPGATPFGAIAAALRHGINGTGDGTGGLQIQDEHHLPGRLRMLLHETPSGRDYEVLVRPLQPDRLLQPARPLQPEDFTGAHFLDLPDLDPRPRPCCAGYDEAES